MTKKQQVTHRWTDRWTDGQTDVSRELTFHYTQNAVLLFSSLSPLMSFSPSFLSILCLSPKPKNNSLLNSWEGETSENLTTSFRGPLVELVKLINIPAGKTTIPGHFADTAGNANRVFSQYQCHTRVLVSLLVTCVQEVVSSCVTRSGTASLNQKVRRARRTCVIA